MNREGFEAQLLKVWMTTRIPLTRANIQFFTNQPRKKIVRWLDELLHDNIVDLDVDDNGEEVYVVKGGARPRTGPTTIAEMNKSGALKESMQALKLAGKAASIVGRPGSLPEDQRKSLAWSGGLSAAFGPLGWLYAAPWKHAVPASVAWVVFFWLLHFLPLPLVTIYLLLAIPSGLAGLGYAWRYNQTGERTPLLPPKE